VTLGYAFDGGLRLEADVASIDLYRKGESIDQTLGLDIAITSAKVLYDIKLGNSGAALYVGAGVISPFGLHLDKDGLDIVGVGVIGVKYALNKNVALDLQYNRGEAIAFLFDGFKTNTSGNNVVKLGVVYNF